MTLTGRLSHADVEDATGHNKGRAGGLKVFTSGDGIEPTTLVSVSIPHDRR